MPNGVIQTVGGVLARIKEQNPDNRIAISLINGTTLRCIVVNVARDYAIVDSDDKGRLIIPLTAIAYFQDLPE